MLLMGQIRAKYLWKNLAVWLSSESSYGEVNCTEMESGPWDIRKWYADDKWALCSKSLATDINSSAFDLLH